MFDKIGLIVTRTISNVFAGKFCYLIFVYQMKKKKSGRCMFTETNGGTNPIRMIETQRESETELRNRIAVFLFVDR